MSSVTKIETAIQKLSVAEQKIIAHHLGERLVDEKYAAADEGIRFLPQHDFSPAPHESPCHKSRKHSKATR